MKMEPNLIIPPLILVFLILAGTAFYHIAEGWSWVDSLYFSTVTLTTVGYGDLYPTHDGTKLFTVFYVLVGVSIALYILINLFGRAAESNITWAAERIHNRRK